MHNLFLVYFVNLYMFRAYLGPSSGGTTVCVQQLYLLFCLDDCLMSWLDVQSKQDIRLVHQVSFSLHDYIEMHVNKT
jgi:hypothetical protein